MEVEGEQWPLPLPCLLKVDKGGLVVPGLAASLGQALWAQAALYEVGQGSLAFLTSPTHKNNTDGL